MATNSKLSEIDLPEILQLTGRTAESGKYHEAMSCDPDAPVPYHVVMLGEGIVGATPERIAEFDFCVWSDDRQCFLGVFDVTPEEARYGKRSNSSSRSFNLACAIAETNVEAL